MVIIILAVLVVLYIFLTRNPSEPTRQSPRDEAAAGGQATEAASETSADPGVAMGKAKLQLESAGNKNIIRVVVDRPAGDEDEVMYRFEWTLNGQPAGDGSDSLSGFKRGDRVTVKVTPVQDGRVGSSKILDFLVQNTPPKVVEGQDMKIEGNTFSYQVKGVDQDGDALSYSLEDAPQGMTIDPQTGEIRWQLKESDYGERIIKAKVSDGKGGVTNYSLKVDFQKPSREKKAGDNQK